MKPPEFNRTLRQLVLLPILLLVLMAGFLVWQIAATTVAQRALDHSDEVTAQLQELQNLFIDQETGLRGFQLTGDPVMLDPWKAATGPIQSHFATLRSMLGGDAAQMQAVDNLEIRYNQWLGFANAVLHQDPGVAERRGHEPARQSDDGRDSCHDGEHGAARGEPARGAIAARTLAAEAGADFPAGFGGGGGHLPGAVHPPSRACRFPTSYQRQDRGDHGSLQRAFREPAVVQDHAGVDRRCGDRLRSIAGRCRS